MENSSPLNLANLQRLVLVWRASIEDPDIAVNQPVEALFAKDNNLLGRIVERMPGYFIVEGDEDRLRRAIAHHPDWSVMKEPKGFSLPPAKTESLNR